jgi:2-methylisocitrate lyase-like PEP mutase family enzyme
LNQPLIPPQAVIDMDKKAQVKKAESFLALHHDPKLLVLPNIWDPLGARLLERLGYPAVATASAAVAFSLGYDDGQRITFDAMLDVIGRVAASVNVPLTADVESGYAENLDDLADNIRRVIRAGAVGVNLEDSTHEGGPLLAVDEQGQRIRAARAAADLEDIPLVINARIDVFMQDAANVPHADKVKDTIERAKAYLDSGADCVYPILVGDLDTLTQIHGEIRAPINVYGSETTAPMRELETAGISRLSVGPWMLKASLTRLEKIATALQNYGSYDVFTEGTMTTGELRRYLRGGKMP